MSAVPLNFFIDSPTLRLLELRAQSLGRTTEEHLADVITGRDVPGSLRPETPNYLYLIQGGKLMADPTDQASDIEEMYRQQAIANRAQPQGESLSHCQACDNEIPVARRMTGPGITLCIGCQSDLDAKQKHWRRV